jgi:hypothetical protein
MQNRQDDALMSNTALLPLAPLDAELDLVVEGATFRCKDGSVMGRDGDIGNAVLRRYKALESRHLLMGKEGGRWFVLTPKTIENPFWMDGYRLVPGERTLLIKIRHHLALDDLRIGLRLKPAEKKSFFGWRF